MTISTAIGPHKASRTGDLMRMSCTGAVKRGDAEGMRAMMDAAVAEGVRPYLVADMSDCTGIEAEARKYMTEWSRTAPQQLSGVAVYGVSFALRAIVSLTLGAIRFLGKQSAEIVFVKDEAEALRWVDAHRTARAQAAPSEKLTRSSPDLR